MMFNLKKIAEWQKAVSGTSYIFTSAKARRLRLNVNSTGKVAAYLADQETGELVLLGAADIGMFEIEAHVAGDSLVQFEFEDGTEVFFAGHAPSHQVEKRDIEKFTSVAPMPARNTEFDRMMMVMRHNENERQRVFQEQQEKLAAQQAAAQQPAPVAPAPAAPTTETGPDTAPETETTENEE